MKNVLHQYSTWLSDWKKRIQSAQIKTALSVKVQLNGQIVPQVVAQLEEKIVPQVVGQLDTKRRGSIVQQVAAQLEDEFVQQVVGQLQIFDHEQFAT